MAALIILITYHRRPPLPAKKERMVESQALGIKFALYQKLKTETARTSPVPKSDFLPSEIGKLSF